MGSSVSARDLFSSLDKARDMGLVEESFELLGQNITIRNLRPTEVEAVLAAVKGLEDLSYLNTYQREHVARGMVEFNGFDLRPVEFIDDEEPDPKKPGSLRKVRVERHKWLADKVISTWGQEAVFVAYRKMGDATEKADKAAKEGVTFLQPDESAEDKIRRLLGEVIELEEDLPGTLLTKVLDDHGLIKKSTLAEMKAAEETLDKLRREEEAKEEASKVKEEASPEPEPAVAKAADLMANRKPMNQQPVVPPPERPAPVQEERAAPPRAAPVQPTVPIGAPSRAAELAALEGSADVAGVLADQMLGGVPVVRSTEVGEIRPEARLTERQAHEQMSRIVDTPPEHLGGLSPKFRPPSKP